MLPAHSGHTRPSPPRPSTEPATPRIKLFGVSLPIKSRSSDEEKALAGPGPSTIRHMVSVSLSSLAGAGVGPRRKRLVVQGLAVFSLLAVSALHYGGYTDDVEWSNWRPGYGDGSTTVTHNHDGHGDSDSSGVSENMEQPAPPVHHPNRPDTTPLTPLQMWGHELRSDDLLAGLDPWPAGISYVSSDTNHTPLSSLGEFADQVYDLGHLDWDNYTSHLDQFAGIAFPSTISDLMSADLQRSFAPPESGLHGQAWDVIKRVWQTAKDTGGTESREVKSWSDGKAISEGWRWNLLTDRGADEYVSQKLRGSRIEAMWRALPIGILRSDTLRYLLLLLEGGIYSDTDTKLLKEPSQWGQGAELWKGGEGWMSEDERARLADGEEAAAILGPPTVIVGVEADVGSRPDWAKWWPRPIQIVQWTMASAPFHPISLSAVLRVLHNTGKAIDWSHEHERIVKILYEQGRYDEANRVREAVVTNEPKKGGPMGVMTWTGPGVWTDAVLAYLRAKYGVLWTDLKGIRKPLRIGDVVVLPVTGFSPGVWNFGSEGAWHREAMVEHGFKGSWKNDMG